MDIILENPDPTIASATEQTSDLPGLVVMIDPERNRRALFADGAQTVLTNLHKFVLPGRQPVPGLPVIVADAMRVLTLGLSPPTSVAGIALRAMRLLPLAYALAIARATIATESVAVVRLCWEVLQINPRAARGAFFRAIFMNSLAAHTS